MKTKADKKIEKPRAEELTTVGILKKTKTRLDKYKKSYKGKAGGNLIASYIVSVAVDEYLDKQGAPK